MKALPTLYERIRTDITKLPALLLIVFFIISDLATTHFPFDGAVKPSLFVTAIFYWGIYRPSLTPIWLIFIIGLITDFLTAAFIGFHTLPFIAVSWIITRQRSFLSGQSFIMIWSIFSGVMLAVMGLQWLASLAVSTNFEWPSALIFSALLSIFIYPLCHMVLFLTHKMLPAR